MAEIRTYIVDKNESEVTFDGTRLSWITKKKQTRHHVVVRAVVGVECGSAKSPQLTVHYLKNKDRYQLTLSKLVLKHEELEVCQQWTDLITSAIQGLVPKRPRRLLVFVNPISGGGHGLSIFHKQVVPLFKLAQVEFELIETKDKNHSKEVLSTYDLTTIDGILVVGGDGSVLQTTSALLHRTMADAGRDVNDPNCELVCTTVPIGVIPAGTGQFMISATTGTKSVSTGVFRILLGDVIKGPIMSVFNEGSSVQYTNFMSAFGMFADLIHTVEQKRHLGRGRYLVGSVGFLFAPLRAYDFEVEVFTKRDSTVTPNEKSENIESKSQAGDETCSEENHQTLSDNQAYPSSHEEKQVFKERFFAVNGNLYGSKAPGFEPTGQILDWMAVWKLGFLQVTLMRPTTRGNIFKFMFKLMRMKTDAMDMSFITHIVCTRLLIKQPAIGQDPQCSSCMNLDGEPIPCTTPLFDLRPHKEKILYFGIPVGDNVPFLDPEDPRS